ncbi:hypothetical protein M0R19_08565 [Candidatus Pacearchaeota archaeon]|jgi:hypothetical protein|nr:hypothetical protein [Candidatus Pacearchaeota archaeon]
MFLNFLVYLRAKYCFIFHKDDVEKESIITGHDGCNLYTNNFFICKKCGFKFKIRKYKVHSGSNSKMTWSGIFLRDKYMMY